MTSSASTAAPAVPPAGDVLGRLRALRAAEAEAARVTMQLVVAWAGEHPGPGLADLPVERVYADHEVELAGPGAPGVSQFALVELATALGMSTRTGRGYVGDALELAHRLPRLWARVCAGHLPTWRARSIAQRTKQLSAAAAAWVDDRLAPVAHKIGPVKTGRLIEQALILFDLEPEVEQTLAELHVTITPLPAGDGLVDLATLEATLQLDDALALEAAIAATAHTLHTDHPDRCLDERRALALGALADHTLAQHGSTPSIASDGITAAGRTRSTPSVREVSVVVHFGEPDLGRAGLARIHTAGTKTTAAHDAGGPGAAGPGAEGAVRGGLGVADRLVTTDAVVAWCTHPGTRVNIRPVLDPAATQTSCPGYTPSPRLRDQVTTLSPTCAFPYCTVPAERCDLDHIQPWATGGRTTVINMAPLCRLHHRVKTHGGWHYTQPLLGTYHWTSPTGHHYHRNQHGTTDHGKHPEPGERHRHRKRHKHSKHSKHSATRPPAPPPRHPAPPDRAQCVSPVRTQLKSASPM